MEGLQRLVLTFSPDGIQARVLYRTNADTGPSTKARRREVAALARTGLQRALEALDAGDVVSIGTSGFDTREDTILCTGRGLSAHSVHKKPTRKGAA